jgi:hypothetical protein
VKPQSYQTFSVIKPEDSAALKAIKADLAAATERLMEEMRIYEEAKSGSKRR